MNARRFLLSLLGILVSSAVLYAQPPIYCPVAFDTFEHHNQQSPNTDYANERIESGDLDASPGRAFDVDGVGYYYVNDSGHTVKSFRVSIRDDMQDRYKFRSEDCNGGELFDDIRVAPDGRSVTFSTIGGGANIPPNSHIYIKFSRRYQENGHDRLWYRGGALTTSPAPVGPLKAFAGVPADLAETWLHFWRNCPSEMRNVSVWEHSDDNKAICAFTNGRCLLFKDGKLHVVIVADRNKDVPWRPNRITFTEKSPHGQQFVLWRNLTPIGEISVTKPIIAQTFEQ
jgi:hypothetical protein